MAMQQSSRIDEPDNGHLMDYRYIADGARIPFERFIIQRVEMPRSKAPCLGSSAISTPTSTAIGAGSFCK